MIKNFNFKFFLIISLALIAIFFRFYQIKDYVVFLGDEGRDMIIMRNIFTKHDIPFLGPTASVGGFYLGPIYYWMAAPFLLLARFDPVGPSYMVAAFGVATVMLLYKFLKDTVGYWPAIYASYLYAIAPLIVRYSRSSWNPNPLPFFILLLLYLTYRAIKKQKILYYIGVGACMGVAIQLHYLAIIMAPITGLIVLFNEKVKKIPVAISLATLGFLITFSPFLLFEIKNNFPNIRTIFEFVTRGSTVGYNGSISWAVADSANIFFEWISKIEETIYTRLFFWIVTPTIFAGLIANWKKDQKFIYTTTIIYFVGGVFFLRLYAGQLHDYYFGSIFPAPFLLFGLFASILFKKNITKYLLLIIFSILFCTFLFKGFYLAHPNKLIEQTSQIASLISEKSDGKPYNFALIAKSNSDHAYRYFLESTTNPPTKLESEVTEQLIVLCEDVPCAPLGHPTWEIAAFGMAEIEGEWDLPKYGFKIFKLKQHESSLNIVGKPAQKGI